MQKKLYYALFTLILPTLFLCSCSAPAPQCPEGQIVKDGKCILKTEPLGSITGKVLLKGLKDHSSIKLKLVGPSAKDATVAADGSYEFKDLKYGQYTLEATAESTLEGQRATVITINKETATTVDEWTFSPVGIIGGKVTRADQKDHAGILVLLANTTKVATTDSDGSYTISGVPVGEYNLKMVDPGYLPGEAKGVKVEYNKTTNASRVSLKVNVSSNKAPVFTSTPNTKAFENKAYEYTVEVEDPEKKDLTLKLVAFPEGMAFDEATKKITWTPSSKQTGPHTIAISAKDPEGVEAFQIYTLVVQGLWLVRNSAQGFASNQIHATAQAGSTVWTVHGLGVARISADGKIVNITDALLRESAKVNKIKILTGGEVTTVDYTGGTFNQVKYIGGTAGKLQQSNDAGQIGSLTIEGGKYASHTLEGGTVSDLVSQPYKNALTTWTKPKYGSVNAINVDVTQVAGKPKMELPTGTVTGFNDRTMTDSQGNFPATGLVGLYLVSGRYTSAYFRHRITANTSTTITIAYSGRSSYWPVGETYWILDGSNNSLWTATLSTTAQVGDQLCFFKNDKRSLIGCYAISAVNGFNLTFKVYRPSSSTINSMKNEVAFFAPADKNGYIDVKLRSSGLTAGTLQGQKVYLTATGQIHDVVNNTGTDINLKVRTSDLTRFGSTSEYYVVTQDPNNTNNYYADITITDSKATWTPDELKGQYFYYNSRTYPIHTNTANTLTLRVPSSSIRYVKDWSTGNDYRILKTSSTSSVEVQVKAQGANWTADAFNGKYIMYKYSTSTTAFRSARITKNTTDTLTLTTSLSDLDNYLKKGIEFVVSTSTSYRTVAVKVSMKFNGTTWTKDQWLGRRLDGFSYTPNITGNGTDTLDVNMSPYDIFRTLKNWQVDQYVLLLDSSSRAIGTLQAKSAAWTPDALAGRKLLLGNYTLDIVKNTANTIEFVTSSSIGRTLASSPPSAGDDFLLNDETTRGFQIGIETTGLTMTPDQYKNYYIWHVSSSPRSVGTVLSNTANTIFLRITNTSAMSQSPLPQGDTFFLAKSSSTTSVTLTDPQGSYNPDELAGRMLYTPEGSYKIESHTARNFDVQISNSVLGRMLAESQGVSLWYILGRSDGNGYDLTFKSVDPLVKDDLKDKTLYIVTAKGNYVTRATVSENTGSEFTLNLTGTPNDAFLSKEDPVKYFYEDRPLEIEAQISKILANKPIGLYFAGGIITKLNGNKITLTYNNTSSSTLSTILGGITNSTEFDISGHLQTSGPHNLVVDGTTVHMLSFDGHTQIVSGKWKQTNTAANSGATYEITELGKEQEIKNATVKQDESCISVISGSGWTPGALVGSRLVYKYSSTRYYYWTVTSNTANSLTITSCNYTYYLRTGYDYTLVPTTFKPKPALTSPPSPGDRISINGRTFYVIKYDAGVLSLTEGNRYGSLSGSTTNPPNYKPFEANGQTFTLSTFIPGGYRSGSSGIPIAMIRSPKGGVWLSGRGGLYLFRGGNYSFLDLGSISAIASGDLTEYKYDSGTRRTRITVKGVTWKDDEHQNKYMRLGNCTSTRIYNNGSDWVEVSGDIRTNTCFYEGMPFQINSSSSSSTASPAAIATATGDDIWVAIGANLAYRQGSKWTIFTPENTETAKNQRDGLNGAAIQTIVRGTKYIWIGTTSGLITYDPAAKKWEQITTLSSESSPGSGDGLISNDVRAIARAKDGTVWIGTRSGVSHYDPAKKTWKQFKSDFTSGTYSGFGNSPLPDNMIYHIFVDTKNIVWMSTYRGLAQYNPEAAQ